MRAPCLRAIFPFLTEADLAASHRWLHDFCARMADWEQGETRLFACRPLCRFTKVLTHSTKSSVPQRQQFPPHVGLPILHEHGLGESLSGDKSTFEDTKSLTSKYTSSGRHSLLPHLRFLRRHRQQCGPPGKPLRQICRENHGCRHSQDAKQEEGIKHRNASFAFTVILSMLRKYYCTSFDIPPLSSMDAIG